MELKCRPFDETKYLILDEYEKILIGEKKKFTIGKTGLRGSYVVSLWWTYALKNICHWDCDQALAFIDDDLVEQLKLKSSFQYLEDEKRPHLTKNLSYEFLVALVYPEEVKYTHVRRTIAEYEKVNKLGMYKNDPNSYTYSKGFWSKHPENAAICLGYCIQNFLNFNSEFELYKYFAAPTGMDFIRSHNLLDAFNKSTDTTTLDFFYHSLNYNIRDEFLYHIVRFQQAQADKEAELEAVNKTIKKGSDNFQK